MSVVARRGSAKATDAPDAARPATNVLRSRLLCRGIDMSSPVQQEIGFGSSHGGGKSPGSLARKQGTGRGIRRFPENKMGGMQMGMAAGGALTHVFERH